VAGDGPSNGWRSGRDPVQRRLRIATTIVDLGVVVFLFVHPNSSETDLASLAVAVSALFVLLGYEGIVKLPWWTK
jgi:hypothetical protein